MPVEITKLKGGAIQSNTVTNTQLASNILPTDRVLKTGDTMTGQLTINAGGLNMETTTTLQQTKERVNVSATALSANLTVDLLNGAVTYLTSDATANCTVNYRGNSTTTLDSLLSTNQSITTLVIVTNGATGYVIENVQIDGASVTPKWSGNTAPTANTNALDAYGFTIIKTATNTYTVLGSKTEFV